MTRYLFLSTLLLALIPFTPAYACSCVAPGSPTAALTEADAVFSGRVLSIETPGGYESLRVQMDVDKVWKGPVQAVIEVRTGRDSAGCGFTFEQGKSYLVYAYESEGSLVATLCSRSNLLDQAAEDTAALGAGTDAPAASAAGGSIQWPLVVLGVLLVAAGAIVTLRRRRQAAG
ncbi:MAG: LPXTG cell wall anchor domain-containing protein [Anaerolineales bacterium]